MVSLVLLALFAAVSGQVCNCYDDGTNGYWTGGTCNACNPAGNPILDTAIAPCTALDSCKDVSRPLAQRACYGIGTCQNNPAQPCNCANIAFPNVTGTYCEQCVAGFTGWPICLTPTCAVAGSNFCNSHGTCDDNAQPQACGVTGCANNVAVLTNPNLCQPVFYFPERQTCATTAAGTAQALAIGAGAQCGGIVCQFGYKCANAAQQVCCYNDYIVCNSRDTSKQTTCCAPTGQTCCEGVCCNSGQSCNAIVSRGFTVTSPMVNTVWNNGASLQSGTSGAYGGGAWTSWKMIDGSTSTPWHQCSPQYLGAVATTRVIILPIGLIFAVFVGLIMVWQTAGLNPIMVAIPAIALIFCSIFLFFSIFWTVAVVISLAALFAMAAGHKGGSAFVAAIAFEFFALAVVCGGLGLGNFFYADNLGGDLFQAVNGAHSPTWGALSSCSQYYDYFSIDPANIPYNDDPIQVYTNYCSNGWYTYIGLVADLVVTFQIIMLVATAVAYLRGGSAPPPKTG